MFRWTRHLQAKLIAIILLTVGIFTSIFVLYSMKETRTVIEEQSDVYGVSLAKGIASACSGVLYKHNYLDLQNVINMIGQSYGDIRAIEIYVADTLVVKHSSIDSDEGTDPSRMISEKGITYSAPILYSIQNEEIDLGMVRVIFSQNRFYHLYMQQMRMSFYSALILLLEISVLLYLLLSQIIVRPISVIEEGTKIIGAGDLNHHIAVNSRDQIGRLADAFNVMTQKLKVSKEEIERWNRTLEYKVKERTIKLEKANEKIKETQFQLMQSSKMAAIGLIGASVAHELNNPLAGIIGYVQFILRKLKNDNLGINDFNACERYLSSVEKEANRCKGIVSTLLNYSKQSTPIFEKVNVKDVVKMALSIMEHQLKCHNVEVATHFIEEDVFVNGNPNRLEQIFINLIANAQQVMTDGGAIAISVDKHGVFDADQTVNAIHIEFTDTGPGIEKENIDKIFKTFVSLKEGKSNLGLGLSISHQIVKEHKGRIDVQSEVGKGTVFTVILPEF